VWSRCRVERFDVLEAAIDTGFRHAVVCTLGRPAVVVTALLEQLSAAGAELRYHGDFDWPGVTIANLLIGSYRWRPARFGTTGISTRSPGSHRLSATCPVRGANAVESCWDP
jgi:hypothetical protein